MRRVTSDHPHLFPSTIQNRTVDQVNLCPYQRGLQRDALFAFVLIFIPSASNPAFCAEHADTPQIYHCHHQLAPLRQKGQKTRNIGGSLFAEKAVVIMTHPRTPSCPSGRIIMYAEDCARGPFNHLKGQPPVLALPDDQYPGRLWSPMCKYPDDVSGREVERVQ